MKLYMIRHGQSYVNLPNWQEGNKDMGLTELGTKQAEALGKWLPSEIDQIDALYVSTMQRAKETAAFVEKAYQIEPIPEPRIREIGNNQLSHVPWANDALPEYGDFWGSERPFNSITPDSPGGESLMHFRIRVGEFLEEIAQRHEKETIVAVCHGGVIDIAFDHMMNIGPWRRCELFTHNTGVSKFQYIHTSARELWRIYYHSKVEHLIMLNNA